MLNNQSTATLTSLPTMESNELGRYQNLGFFAAHETSIQQSMGNGMHLAHNWNRRRAIRPGDMVKGIESTDFSSWSQSKHQEEGAHLLRNRFICVATAWRHALHIKLIILGWAFPAQSCFQSPLSWLPKWDDWGWSSSWTSLATAYPSEFQLEVNQKRKSIHQGNGYSSLVSDTYSMHLFSFGSKKDCQRQRPTFHVW